MPTYTPSNIEYVPRTMAEMLQPLAVYKQQYDEYEQTAENMKDRIAFLQSNISPDDKVSQGYLSDTLKAYNDAVDSIYNYGLSANDRQNFINARNLVRDKYIPLTNAYERYAQFQKEQEKNMANEDYRWKNGIRPNSFMVSDFLNGNNPEVSGIQGDVLKGYSAELAKGLFNISRQNTSSDGSSSTVKGFKDAERHVTEFANLLSSGNIEAAKKIEGGRYYDLFNRIKEENGINSDNYNSEDLQYLNGKIIDGIFSSIVDNTSYQAAPERTNNESDGSPMLDKSGWRYLNIGMNTSSDDIDGMVRIKREGKDFADTWGLGLIKKTTTYNGTKKEKIGLRFDNFLTVKDGNVVLKSDKEIRDYIKDRNKDNEISNDDLKSIYAENPYYILDDINKVRLKYKVKDWQVDRYLKQIKNMYNTVTDIYGKLDSVEKFMEAGSTAFTGNQSSLEKIKAYGGRYMEFDSPADIMSSDIEGGVMSDGKPYSPHERTKIIVNPRDGKIHVLYDDIDKKGNAKQSKGTLTDSAATRILGVDFKTYMSTIKSLLNDGKEDSLEKAEEAILLLENIININLSQKQGRSNLFTY
mgnify:CR=1 FL=1